MDNRENLLGVIKALFKWKKPIMLTVLITAIGTALLAVLLLDNYYEGKTIFYAASTDLAKPQHIFGESNSDMDYYGDDTDLDHLMTVAKSSELINFMVKEFDLYTVYDINPEKEKAAFKVKKKFSQLYNVIKNKYEAIELTIEDKDPERAAKMANAARNKINEISVRLLQSNQSQIVETFERNIIDKEKELKMLGDSLIVLRQKYGVYDIETQSELLSKLVATAESKLISDQAKYDVLEKSPGTPRDTLVFLSANISGLEKELESLTSSTSTSRFNLSRFNKGMAQVEVLSNIHENTSSTLSFVKDKYAKLKSALGSPFASVIIVEPAGLPDNKSRPKRSIIVLVAVLAALLFSVVGALLYENYRDINWKEITNA